MNLDNTRAHRFVCAWCPDKAAKDAAAKAAGHTVTHGICDVCMAQEFGALRLRQVARDVDSASFSLRPV